MKIKKIDFGKIKSELKKRSFVILAIILLAVILNYAKSWLIVAVVNNKPILRFTLIKELEKQAGKGILDSLITKSLILQEAKKQNIKINDDEINQEIKQLEENLSEQGQDLDQVLEAQGVSKDELREQIKIQKIVEKIVGQNINITDEEVNDYIEENKDLFAEDADPEKTKEDVKQQLKQQKMNNEIPAWIESLHDNASIRYFLR